MYIVDGIHYVLRLSVIRKVVFVISSRCSAHLPRSSIPLSLTFPTPCRPITPVHTSALCPTLALQSPRRKTLLLHPSIRRIHGSTTIVCTVLQFLSSPFYDSTCLHVSYNSYLQGSTTLVFTVQNYIVFTVQNYIVFTVQNYCLHGSKLLSSRFYNSYLHGSTLNFDFTV